MELNTADIQAILRIFADSEMRDLHIEVGGTAVHVSKDTAAAGPTAAPASDRRPSTGASDPVGATRVVADRPAPLGDDGEREGLVAVRSPAVGIFYRRPAPDKPPYVEVGANVGVDSPVCTIEVMKMFTEVLAGCAGTVVEICAENEQLVEHGQVLLYVEPS